jgi:DNA-binding GntR family transcriptional regulator
LDGRVTAPEQETETAQPSTHADVLAERISGAIMTGEYAVGTWLRQETLAEHFGVSRQPVREALRQVQASGLVEVIPHRGALVRGPSPQDIREAYLVRAELEGLAAELAAARPSLETLDELRGAAAAFTEATRRLTEADESALSDEKATWARANDQFHEAVLAAAGVGVLSDSITALHRLVPRNLTWSAIRTPRMLEDNVEQHRRVLDAIEAGDATAARAAMRTHVRRSGEMVADWFERQQEAEAEVDTGRRRSRV